MSLRNFFKIYIFLPLIFTGIANAGDALVIRYELNLNISPASQNEAARIEGVNRVWIRNNWDRPIGELHFHNSPNQKYGSKGQADSYTEIGRIRSSSLGKVTNADQLSMQVGLFPALNPGEEVVLEIPFVTTVSNRPSPYIPTVGSEGDTVIYSLVNFYPVLEFFYPDGWHPREHTRKGTPVTNFAEYEAHITYPRDYKIGCSANLIKENILTSSVKRSSFHSQRATRLSILLANKLNFHQESISGINVELMYSDGENDLVAPTIAKIHQLADFYEGRFGKCPSNKLFIGPAYSLDTATVIGPNYIVFQKGLKNGMRSLPHEFAHQWFGNAIVAEGSNEEWLIESFAEYSAWLFQKTQKQPEKHGLINSAQEGLAIWREFDDLPVEEIMRRLQGLLGSSILPPVYQSDRQTSWENSAQLYSRFVIGNHALQMLESAVSDSVMQIIMRQYIAENLWKYVSAETFVSTVSRVANNRIGSNFRLALTTNLKPDYKIVSVETKGRKDRRWETRIVTDFKGPWILPIDITAVTENGDTVRYERVRLQNDSDINLVTSSPVQSVVLDPDKKTFDSNRFNNRWPRTFLLEPIYGMPSWEVYKVYYRPVLRQDWRREWRLGVRVSGGLGLNLMPLLPAIYQNSFDVEIDYSPALDDHQIGVRLAYRKPINSKEHTFWEVKASWEYPRNEQSLSLSRYIGKTSYLVANRKSAYQRITGQIKRTEFINRDVDQNRWLKGQLLALQADLVRFRYEPKQRSNMQLAVLAGEAINDKGGAFYRLSALVDFERRLFDQLIVRTHFENGYVWDERESNYLRYQLEHQLKAWRSRTNFVPLFRGLTPVAKERWDSVLGFGLSIGYATSLPAWPMVYLDGAMAEQDGGSLKHRWDRLSDNPVYASAGIGIESQTLLELGLYLPLWISHPIGNGSRWGWRWLVQVGFYF